MILEKEIGEKEEKEEEEARIFTTTYIHTDLHAHCNTVKCLLICANLEMASSVTHRMVCIFIIVFSRSYYSNGLKMKGVVLQTAFYSF